MIKVVVADDEERVCKLICGLIDWSAFGMEIVGVAHNGLEALELIERLQPDLTVTDIRMPGYDGLEMIRRAKELCPELNFIIISGYRDFDYAQSAIKYGVSDYLLKPVNRKEFAATLEKVQRQYRQRREEISDAEQLKLRLQSDIDKLRSGLFTDLLGQNAGESPALTLENVNRAYHFHFQPGIFQAFIVKIDCAYDDFRNDGLKVLYEKVFAIFRAQLDTICTDFEMCLQRNRIYGVLNYPADAAAAARKGLKDSMDELLVQKTIYGKVEFTLGVGVTTPEVGQLAASMDAALAAADQRLIEGTGRLIDAPVHRHSELNANRILFELNKNMSAGLELLDTASVTAAIDTMRDEALAVPGVLGHELYQLALAACNLYLMLLRGQNRNFGQFDEFYSDFSNAASFCSSSDQLFGLLKQRVEETLEEIIRNQKLYDTKPIRTAKQYIQENYMRPISLEEVSLAVGFNASYFSSLFKKETGENFSEYLSEVRMNRAKELLRETNHSISGICEMVGYTDIKHFTKTFKKHIGIKPTEFRKLYS